MNIKRILCGVVVACLLLHTATVPTYGTGLVDAQHKKEKLANELNQLNNQLAALSDELNALEEKMKESEAKVSQLNEEIARLEEEKSTQYENMKLRIQYTYENSNANLLEALLESETLAEFVSRAEYFAVVMDYDRRMMERYEALIVTIEDNKASVVAEQEVQAGLVKETQLKQNQILATITNTQQSLSSVQSEIDDYIAQIEEEEDESDVGTPEPTPENKPSTGTNQDTTPEGDKEPTGNGGSNTGGTESAESDLMLLAAIIECEAVGEPYEGKIAVGSVVMNRINSPKFPNTMVGVIYQKGQFSPVATGKLAGVLARGAKQSCIDAARDVLNGMITLDCLFFRVNDGRDGIVIGNHVFY